MSKEPAERGWWKRRSRTPKLGIAAVGVMVVLLVIILAVTGCGTGTVSSPLTSGATTTTGAKATTTTSAEATTTTSAEATTTTGAAGLELSIVGVTSPVSSGSSATVTAKTAPGADCSIVVQYEHGESTAQGLESKNADGAGNVSWTWKVSPNTTPGTWPISVTASMDGQSVTTETTFVVK